MRVAVRLLPSFVFAVAVAAAATACGPDGTGEQLPGRAIARDRGCLACHGSNGEGGTGPKWVGLYGSQVELKDGTTVTADEAYLRLAITDPAAQVPKGVTLVMPVNKAVTPDEVDKIVAYIASLSAKQ